MVLLSHGISEKKYVFEDDSQRIYRMLVSYDKIFISSKAQYDRLCGLFSGEFAKNFEYVGYPRLHQLINNSFDRIDLRKN